MYEFIISIMTTLILTSTPIFIKYIMNNLINIIKYYTCLIKLTKLSLET
ncbi:Uncharacterised protein [[Clostridium] sordellii]|nr:Uncharacterised protein [[Clostridium] sordellii] [Paeniclostridium sordellii]